MGTRVQEPTEATRTGSPRAEVIGSCEPPIINAGNGTRVPCRNSTGAQVPFSHWATSPACTHLLLLTSSCHLPTATATSTLHPPPLHHGRMLSSGSSVAIHGRLVLNAGEGSVGSIHCLSERNPSLPNLPQIGNPLSFFGISAKLWFHLGHNLHNLVLSPSPPQIVIWSVLSLYCVCGGWGGRLYLLMWAPWLPEGDIKTSPPVSILCIYSFEIGLLSSAHPFS